MTEHAPPPHTCCYTQVQGADPSPRPGATLRAKPESSAVWVRPSEMQLSGILLATGARAPMGKLCATSSWGDEILKNKTTDHG
jgi:hypothetical protein